MIRSPTIPHPTDLRSSILREASELFMQQGYAATSIKQIAQAAGCTTAALYYYFEGGKSQILQEAIRAESLLDVFQLAGRNATTLEQLLQRIGHIFVHIAPELPRRMNWLMLEYPQLRDEEKAVLHKNISAEQHTLATQIGRFVPDPVQAQTMAWLVFCAYLGYGQVNSVGVATQLSVPTPDAYVATVSRLLAQTLD
jgi:AcrR family transcriptional regulator